MKKWRTKLLILPTFQKEVMYFLAVVSVFICLINWMAVELFFYRLEKVAGGGLSRDPLFFRLISDQYRDMILIYGASMIIIVAVLICTGLYLSQRIAGPINKIKL